VLVAVGLNQRVASVADREVVTLPADLLRADLAGDAALGGIEELAVLSTCYRVEVYAAASCPSAATLALTQALQARAGRSLPLFELHGEEAFRHLVRVTASLESAVVGEPQILAQVKDAFERAAGVGPATRELAGVLARALAAAGRVRTETAIGRAGVSWGHATVALAAKVMGPVAGRRVAVIGAGRMAELAARHLRGEGAELVILNRTLARAEALAGEVQGRARPLEGLGEELARADLVVSAVPLAPAALAAPAVAQVMRERRRRMVLVDLAVPRAIPAETGAVPDVFLCDVDDLDRVMTAALAEQPGAPREVERLVEEETRRFALAEAEERAAPLLQELRSQATAIARGEVERTLRRLGEDPELERRLDAMAGSIVSRLLHEPSARLREAVRSGGAGEELISAAVRIFGLSSTAAGRSGA